MCLHRLRASPRLRIWRCSSGRTGCRWYRLSLTVHKMSLDFPALEQRALADQLRRASKSICANIAEGYGKQAGSPAEFKRYLLMAIGSADEIRLWSRYCLDLGYIAEATWCCWSGEYKEIARMLQGLRRSWR